MEQDLKTSKTPARPSHGAIEDKVGAGNEVKGSADEKMDQIAMQGAKRAEHRIHNNEENIPGSTIFSK